MDLKPFIAEVINHRDLTFEQAREAMDIIMSGAATSAQIGSYLTALRMKGEASDEIAGSAASMRSHVIGIDVEEPVCIRARQRVEDATLSDRIEIRQAHPGPLPFDDNSLDIVFSKDAIVHIPDKESLARDVFRVLKPGGWFVASDWLIAHDDEPATLVDIVAQGRDRLGGESRWCCMVVESLGTRVANQHDIDVC